MLAAFAERVWGAQTTCDVNGRRVPLIDLIIQQTASFPTIWQNANCVRLVKQVLDISLIPSEHPFYQNTLARLASLSPYWNKETATTFDQENLRIKKVIEDFQINGSKYTEIELVEVNDALLKAVSKYCPNIISLVLSQRNGSASAVTDEGLLALQSLSKLQKLKVEGLFPYVSQEAFEKFLATPSFIAKISEINIDVMAFSDNAYRIVVGYKSLVELALRAYYLTSLISSYPLPAGLKVFKLEQPPGFAPPLITDPLLIQLMKCNLNILRLMGSGVATDSVLISLFNSQKSLISLGISFQRLTAAVVNAIPSKMLSLHLGQLSEILDYKTLFSRQTLLAELQLHDATHLKDEDLASLSAPLIKVTLDAPSLKKVPDIKSLAEITLKGNQFFTPESFAVLTSFPKLSVLRVLDCPRFNTSVLNTFLNSPLKHQLRQIELDGVNVDKLMPLVEFGNLTVLGLGNCFGVTADDLTEFLGTTALQTNLRALYLDNMVVKKVHLMLLCEFGFMVILYIGNPIYLSQEEVQDIYKLPILIHNNAEISIWNGLAKLMEFEKSTALLSAIIKEEGN